MRDKYKKLNFHPHPAVYTSYGNGSVTMKANRVNAVPAWRWMAGSKPMPEQFVEVWVNPGLEVCEERDPKGLYQRARSGEIAQFTGVSAPYETPEDAELDLDTGALSLADSVDSILAFLRERGLVP